MIFDNLKNLASYVAIAPEAIPEIIAFLEKCNKENISDGKYEIIGSKLYVNVQSYNTKTLDRDKLEYHKEYADMQLLLAGKEILYFTGKNDGVILPYDQNNDYGLNRLPETALPLNLEVGNFVLLLPEEEHLPGVGNGDTVVKAVVKIHKDLIN